MCLLATHLQQCRSSLCLHPWSALLFSCFYIASLWLLRFLWVGRKRVIFAPSSLCLWSQKPLRSWQIILLRQVFFNVHFLEFDGSISQKSILVLPKYLTYIYIYIRDWMSVTLSSLLGKFKCSLLNVFFFFLSWWNYSQLRFNWTD